MEHCTSCTGAIHTATRSEGKVAKSEDSVDLLELFQAVFARVRAAISHLPETESISPW